MGKSSAIRFLEDLDGSLTIAKLVKSTRVCDEYSRAEMARILETSVQYLCDVEKGRRVVKPARAYAWGTALKYSGIVWARVAAEEAVRRNLETLGLDVHVKVSIVGRKSQKPKGGKTR